MPIPGGIQLPDGPLIHVRVPGDPAVTLPFTAVTLEGFEVEPSTLTDFDGSSAVAYHVGSATGSDGKTYDLETACAPTAGRMSTARERAASARSPSYEWISSSPVRARKVHDFNGGILPSGLFWTLPVDDDAIWVSRDGREAALTVEDVPMVDSFQFLGSNQTPAFLSLEVRWTATRDFADREAGGGVPPTPLRRRRGRGRVDVEAFVNR